MFAKLATTRAVGRPHMASALMPPLAHANDNRRDWRLAGASPRRRRERLVCRWRLSAATGKPECFWEIAGGETGAAEDAEPVPASPLSVAAPLRRAKRAVRHRRATAEAIRPANRFHQSRSLRAQMPGE